MPLTLSKVYTTNIAHIFRATKGNPGLNTVKACSVNPHSKQIGGSKGIQSLTWRHSIPSHWRV